MFLQWFKGRNSAQVALTAPSPALRATSTAAAPAAVMAAPHAVVPAPWLDNAALAHLFQRWLQGSGDAGPRAPAQPKVLLDALQRLAASPGAGAHLVPRVPAIIPQLLRSLRDEHMSGADVSRLLAQDVVLVAQVIRAANSPFYSPRAPIQTIESAILLLGQNGMRALLAQVAFWPVIGTQTGKLARTAAPQAWRHAEQCAQAATLLAPRLRANPFEAYLAGLMQNVGLIVTFRLFDQIDPDLVLPSSAVFDAGVAVHARTLSARIAALWELPPAVVEALSGASGPQASPLARTLALADHVAKLRVLVDAGLLDAADPATLGGMDAAALACFARLAAPDA